ncbi:MAG: DUF3047 domain-containing protein [Hyphomicrobiales bacterium]
MTHSFSGLAALCAFSASIFISSVSTTNAETVSFGAGWKAVDFRSIPKTDYGFGGSTLSIKASKSSSVIYKPVPETARDATKASWNWSVQTSVPPTNLAKKGGDDRNIALYFVFTDADTARRAGKNPNIKRLLTKRSSRMLIYVNGGQHGAGSFVPSPYFSGRGTTIVKRSAGTGSFSESVDLAADYRRAFGSEPMVLVGLAVSSDSDDTGTVSQSTLSAIVLN